jgi:transcriptional regulator with XRE-family HTH domain
MKQLGVALGAAESTVSHWETNQREPDIETLNKLAEYLNVSIDFLIGRPYTLTIPVERWPKSLQQDYSKASKEEKTYMEYKYGGVIFECDKLRRSPAFTEEERALGLSDNHPIALSDDDRELINLFAEAEERLGKNYVKAIKQMVRLQIDSKDKS